MALNTRPCSAPCGAVLLLPAFVVLFNSLASAGELPLARDAERNRVFLLRVISAKEGIQLLADANIAKATPLNDGNMLLVTAEPEQLVRAANMLKLVDSAEKYSVKVLLPASEANRMTPLSRIESEVGNISIGTFFNLPGGTGLKAIIDTHPGAPGLLAVAPASVMSRITAIAERAVPRGPGLASPEPADEPKVTSRESNEPNALFNELLNSLAEAEKIIKRDANEEKPGLGGMSRAEPNRMQPGSKVEKNTTQETAPVAKDANDKSAETRAAEANEPNAAGEKEQQTARSSYEPLVVPHANETLELTLPDKLGIIELLDLVGKYLNLNYVYDENKIKGMQVNLKVQGPIKVRELYPLAESVLKFTNLVMTRKGNLVTIVPIGEALEVDPMLIEDQRGQVQAGDVVVTRIFQLNYIDTQNARAILEGMRLGAVTELPTMGTLIVTGYAYRMNRVEQLLEVVDKPGRPKQFKYRQLKYTMAKTLAPKIKQLVEQLGDISIAVAVSQPAQPVPRGRTARGRAAPVRGAPPATPESAKSAVYLDADERTNRILMIGSDEEIAVVEDLIDALDVAQQDLRSLRVYEIQHVDAEEVRKKLESLGIVGASREQVPGRITARRTAARAPGQPEAPPTPSSVPTAGGEVELPTEEVQVVVLESTNSLMVNASPEQHVLIATIIGYVDSESIQQAIPYVVYPLQNQPPEHVAEVLEKLIQEYVQGEQGKVEKVKKTEEDIIIVPDPSTFSLIVYASKKNQDWVASLIKSLDRRRPQVLIDVTLVEVTKTDAFDLDLTLASKFPKMVTGENMDVLGAIVGGKAGGDAAQTSFIGKSTEAYSSPATGIAQGFYSDEHIQALLTAMESKRYGRVLAKPKILVNDGQKGIIRTTDTTNVRVETVIIPEQGNAQSTTDFRQYDAGITLEIQPNIGEGDLLLLIVRLERKDFTNKIENAPPDTTSSNVETIVTVPNDKTIILGGLLKLSQSKGGSKVPLLGDIPIVGGLFRSTSNSATDSKLYVFVKANILRPEALVAGLPELERFSERNRAAFEQAEDRFQKYEDWPGIKPKMVDPPRVLDAE